MLKSLPLILDIQELDIQMIQLLLLRKKRQKELNDIKSIKEDLRRKVLIKEGEIIELKKDIRIGETDVAEINDRIKKLESQQSAVKKVEEFNALSHEMSSAMREKTAKELRLSDFYDKLAMEEEELKLLNETLDSTISNSKLVEDEIRDSIVKINAEGRIIKVQRDKMAVNADMDVLRVYERLLRNKRDRVVVPIENRCCSGCHIMLTAQDENLVRKGERLVFCEHCSRIHFWQESEALEGSTAAPTKTRRRRSPAKA